MSLNILAIGAYERDNFGDFLFYEVLNRYLKNTNIIPGSIIYSDMSNQFGIKTLPYDFLLSRYKFDVVWVVGGELGAVGVQGALKMSLPNNLREKYLKLLTSNKIKKQIEFEKKFSANRANFLAYIPRLKNYPLNKDTALIINSAGVSNTPKDKSALETISAARFISVRENKSLKWCEEISITAQLAPDAVHSLGLLYKPNLKDTGLVFQANAEFIVKNGLDTIAEMLTKVYDISDKKIKLIAAGTAFLHDDLSQLHQLKDKISAKGINVEVIYSRKPLDIVDEIASASMVIATSLHVRVVAATYGIKRISLENEKVAIYSDTWDKELPHNIRLNKLVSVAKTVRQMPNRKLSNIADKLNKESINNLTIIKEILPKYNSKKIDSIKIEEEYIDFASRLHSNTISAKLKDASKLVKKLIKQSP